jgi:predicted transcriptional regulator/uncharacterized protein YegL
MRKIFLPLIVAGLLLYSLNISTDFISGDPEGAQSLDYNSMDIKTVIRDHYAITEFTASIRNPGTTDQEEVFRLQVPESAMLTNLSLELNGIFHYASIATKEDAQKQYDYAKENDTTASQITSSDEGEFLFHTNIAPGEVVNFSIRYEQMVIKKLGFYRFDLDLDSIGGYSLFDEVNASVSLHTSGRIETLNTGNSTVALDRTWDGNKSVRMDHFSMDPENGDSISISFCESDPPIEGNLRVHIDGEKGYFMHVFSPEIDDVGSFLPKDIIFILDKSGSMEGEKISQMKDAFNEVVDQLHSEDRFDLITFSSDVEEWKGEIVDATTGNKESAKTFISRISAGGSTNIIDSLITGLDQMEHDQDRVPVIVFLTDGQPTSGPIQDPEGIRVEVLDKNEMDTTIYSLGFGDDLDFDFIKALSLENNGFAVAIPEGGDASSFMTGFYDTISTPLVKDLVFEYSGMAYDIIPRKIPSLYQGSEAVVVGRFDPDSDTITSNVSGITNEGLRYWEQEMNYESDENNPFIERLWAYRVIQSKLDDILVEGETEPIVEKIISIAMNYSFVTPYTSFILVVEEEDNDELSGDDVQMDDDGESEGRQKDSSNPPGFNPGSGMENYDDDDDYEPTGSGSSSDDNIFDPFNLKESDEENDSSPFFLFLAIGVVLLIILIIGAVIYTRLREDDLLKQENRKKIYEYIMNNPGDHFRAIQRAVELEVGTLSHHLNILEKEQLIISEQDGNNRLFWVAGVKRDTGKIRLSRIQENILKQIQEEPGITQVQIARKVGVSRKVVFYHVKFLANAEMVMEEKVKRRAHYYPNE